MILKAIASRSVIDGSQIEALRSLLINQFGVASALLSTPPSPVATAPKNGKYLNSTTSG